MLGKLLKYDLKSMFRVFGPLWLALLAVSFINRFTMYRSGGSDLPTVIFVIAYACLICGVMVMTLVLIVQRFYNGLLKSEGYLMFTLPVRPWQLIASKALAAAVILILSIVAAILSALIVAKVPLNFPDWADLKEIFPKFTGDMVITLVLTALVALGAALVAVGHIYAALSLGHLANSHRVAWAFAAYIGINILISSVGNLLGELTGRFKWTIDIDGVAAMNLALLIILLGELVVFAVFFVTSERILSKRLNLE